MADLSPTPTSGRLVDATFTTLTRPTNTTAYTANDSISDNATAGSVTPLGATIPSIAGSLLCLTEILLDTNDTGLGNAISVRAFLYNSDPTANSGVVGGDNAAFSNNRAGFVGSMSGSFRQFADGGKARLVPDEGSFIIVAPSTSAFTLWIQYQATSGFTPSANSTTIIGKIKGFEGRA